jgi:hypothetical protein
VDWAGSEVKQIKAYREFKYVVGEKYRDYPHGVEGKTNPAPYPIYLHVGYRSPEQAMARVRHNAESGFNPEHRGLLDDGAFLKGLARLGAPVEYNGDFGRHERPDLYRYFECEHRRKKDG